MLEQFGHTLTTPLAAIDPLSWLITTGKILIVILGFSVVVFFHELGHFLAAKWAGVRVDKFAIGFGKELFGFNWGETRYSFNLLPLGGYVKMLGQEDFAVDKSGEWSVKDDPNSFINKPVGKRMVIVSAGVIMNIIFAAILYMIVFMIGFEAPSADIGMVLPDSPADMAGLRPGDHVVSIDGSKVHEFFDVMMAIVLAQPYEPLHFKVERDGKIVNAAVVPELSEEQGKLNVGISQGLSNRIGFVADSVDVPGEPALKAGDTIVRAGDQPVGEFQFYRVWQALLRANGTPVKLTVERKTEPNAKPELTDVYVHAPLALLPQVMKDIDTENFLGLVPRRRIDLVDEDTPGEKAGFKTDDVIVDWEGHKNPTYGEITKAILNADDSIQATVLRNGELIKLTVEPQKTGLWWKKRELKVGISFQGIEETAAKRGDHTGLVVSQLIDEIQGEPTALSTLLYPAQGPGDEPIKPGAMLISAAGTPLDAWRTLVHLFETKAHEAYEAGHSTADLPLTYLNLGETTPVTRTVHVPVSLKAATGLGAGAVITEIAGERTAIVDMEDGEKRTVGVHVWRAAKSVLRRHVNETVDVKYKLLGDNTERTVTYRITPDSTDPWMMRVSYIQALFAIGPYATMTKLVARNPLEALWIGIRKTGYVITSAYLTFKRMVIDRTVGVENISGPVGIVKAGTSFLDAGFVKLMYFMALISANLAVINFLPLPIVDGGLFVFLIIEKIKGSPISLKTQVATQIIGLVLIVAVFLFVTVMDISKL